MKTTRKLQRGPIRVSVRHPNGKYYVAHLSPGQARAHDNGALISCGLTVGEDLKHGTFQNWLRQGLLDEISQEKYNHSGCQSSCILRGDLKCGW